MDQEVAKTLGELELKLQQLENELTAIGPSDAQAAFQASSQDQSSHQSGRLVDEAMELSRAAEAIVDSDDFGGPPVFGGEEVPAQPNATGQDWKVDIRETAYGEIPSESPPEHPPAPAPQPDPEPIDRAELVRFKQRLERTMAELNEELARLLLPKPPA